MSDWSQIFVGRERELGILKAAYSEAALGQTKVVSVIAESGFGKTRLVQQFYNWLSTHHDGTTGRGYWPDSLARNDDTLTISPLAEECGIGSGQIPFLWWGLRLSDPLARNGIIGGSLWAGVDALKPHLALLEKELQKSAITSRRNKVLASGAIDLSMEAANIFTFGLMGVGKTFVEKGKELYDIQMESRALDGLGTDPTAARKQARDKLTATILTDLHRIAKAPPKGISPVPVVVVIDDVQWIHQDTGLADLATSLVQRGRAENWPLLIIMTSWEKEWRESRRNSTSPATLCNEQKGDLALHLLPAPYLDEIIPHVFPGLTDEQKSVIVEQVDGNPRFLNELLQFLLRNQRYFEGRDQSGPLTARGVEELTAMSFPDFVGNRFADAPENVRKALSLASTHGIIFAPRLVDLMSEHLHVTDSSAGLLASEDPYGFATFSSETELGEFRIRAYRNVAADELENFFDRDAVDEAVSFSHTAIIGNITAAKDVELKHILTTASDPAAIEVAIELVHRANQIGDPRTAGEISTSVLERLGDVIEHGDLTALTLLLNASWVWNGPRETSVSMLGRVVDRLKSRAAADLDPGLRVQLARTLELFALGTLAVHGPKPALPLLEACAELDRQLAEEQDSVETRRNYAWSLAVLGDVVEDLQGPRAVELLRRANVTLCRDLASEIETAASLEDYAHSLTRLGKTIGELEGQDEARSFHEEAIAVFRKIDEMSETSASLLNLANALAQYSVTVEAIEGDASACPWLEEAVALFDALAKDQGTPAVRRHLADSLGRLGAVVKRLEGSAAARPLRHREVALCLSLFEEMDLPGDRFRLACSLASLAEVVKELDGPALALDIQEEAISQLRATLADLKTAEVKMNLALECANLAEIIEELERKTAAQSAREEALALFETIHHDSILTMRRRLHLTRKVNAAAMPLLEHDVAECRKQVKLLDSLEARSDLADALYRLGCAVEGLGRAGASRVIREEEVATRRVLSDTLGTPEAHYAFAKALARYGKLILHFDGPVEAETIFREEVSISYFLVEEGGSVRARRQLIDALAHYDGMYQKISPYRALTQNEIVNRKFTREEIVNQERAIAHEEQTPEAYQRLSGALRDYAEIVRQCDGLAAARPMREEVVALSRSRANSEQNHGSLGVLADDIAALARLIEQTEGVASAISLMEEEVDIRRKITLRAPFADSAQLAFSLSCLGRSVRQLRGPVPARPYCEEQVSVLRDRVRQYNSAFCKSSLAYGLLDLAEFIDALEGPAAADSLRREAETLHSAIQVENEELVEWDKVDLDFLTARLASNDQLSLGGDPIM